MKRIVKAGAVMAVAALMVIPVKGDWVNARSGLNVRSTPSTDAEIVAVLPFTTEVKGTIKDGWMQIEGGYVSTEFLQDADPLADAEYLGSWLCTAYTHSGMPCADGSYPQAGYSVATNSLPLGTEIFVSGVGFRTVTDRGPSSMPSAWLDVFLDSYSECVTYGEQVHDVWLLNEKGDE